VLRDYFVGKYNNKIVFNLLLKFVLIVPRFLTYFQLHIRVSRLYKYKLHALIIKLSFYSSVPGLRNLICLSEEK